MKPITKQHNIKDYFFLLSMAFFSLTLYLIYYDNIWLIVAVVMISLAAFRKFWLHKRLK